MSESTHGHTASGTPITDADAQRLADEAERACDPDPELRDQLTERARVDGTTPSEVIRKALRDYLHAA